MGNSHCNLPFFFPIQKALSASVFLFWSGRRDCIYSCLPRLTNFSCRWNLTANAARPNPQGSFHYGKITPSRTIVLVNSAPIINGKQRYTVNGASYVNADTPVKLADYFNIPGVFSTSSLRSSPSGGSPFIATSVLPANLHDFLEIVFQNSENTIQSWHLDGYDFWVVG